MEFLKRNNYMLKGSDLFIMLMAIKNKPKQQKVILHSDQGSTYRTDSYLDLFNTNNIEQSMSAKKIVLIMPFESFFGTLKTELVYEQSYLSRKQAGKSIFEYIEVFYNRIRRHSTLNYLSPENFEKAFYNTNECPV